MKKNKRALLGIVGILLTFGIIFMGCPTNNSDDPEDTPFDTRNAAIPVITLQPASTNYSTGDEIQPLTVKAAVSDSGTLSYQWYSNTSFTATGGTTVPSAIEASYTPPAPGSEAFYYVVVTNTNNNAEENKTATRTSSPVRIKVSSSAAAPNASITVNTATKYQYVRGFGGMANVWTSPDMSVKDIDTMFSPDGLGLNIFRICLYPDMNAIITNDEIPNRDNSDYYELVKRVNAYRGYVLASPWTPPAEWKTNSSRNGGGSLKPANYIDYAQHLKAFSQTMRDNGAPIYAVSIQNEPNYVANYDGCEWTPSEMRDFFKQQKHFTDGVKGYGGGKETPAVLTMNGESANNPNINDAAMDDAESAKYIDLIGYHMYGGYQAEYTKAHALKKETWMTEHNINTTGDFPSDSTWAKVWLMIDEVHASMADNNDSAWIWWYAKRFYSLIGDGEYGTVEGQPLWRGIALSHYSKFAADTTRVNTAVTGITDTSNVKITAYESMDKNSISLVMYNKSSNPVGDIQINLPADFAASSVYAVISDGTKKAASELVVLSRDKKSGIVTLPRNAMISVKFTK